MTDRPKVASRVVGSGLSGPLCNECTHEVGEDDSWPTTVIGAFVKHTESHPGECLHVVLESSIPEGRCHLDAECIQCTPELRWGASSLAPRMYCARSRKWRVGYMLAQLSTPTHVSDDE